MPGRATGFGAAAAAYERFRPGYPEQVADLVEAFAGQPIRTALEIGAGTGKATRLFARRGVRVTASDPDAAMLEQLRRSVPDVAGTVHASFEQLQPDAVDDPEFDLVFAAAALHWTDPTDRWPRIARWLRPGGIVASFGGPFELADADVADAVRGAREPYLDTDDVPSPDGTPPTAALQWPGTEITRSPWFTDVMQAVVPRSLRLPTADYAGYLSTVSAYLQLPPPTRRLVLARVSAVLPAMVDVRADVIVHLARRVTDHRARL